MKRASSDSEKPRLDSVDRNILTLLQRNARRPLQEIADEIGTSKTRVWSRVRKLQQSGIITRFTVEIDADLLGFEACFFVLIRTSQHEPTWQRKFLDAVRNRPEVLEAHRLAGDIDYILKVRVANARAYDKFYQAMIDQVNIFNVTALLSMEEIKYSTMPGLETSG
ncbi:MAG: Lrp/AsnC family transcriptional regulator [Rhodobacteraceae bacterium]|nr:Lrp/AsnC family transcriptional regulator [Paracoccaceae bacterium]